MESPTAELMRILYHLDYFRRNFRKISWHQCTKLPQSPCLVCRFKELFHELSIVMREPVLDPPLIRELIEAKCDDVVKPQLMPKSAISKTHSSMKHGGSSVSPALLYENVMRQLDEQCNVPDDQSSTYNTQGMNNSKPNFKIDFSLTKICLACRTTNHVDAISQYMLQVDSATLVSNDWPSFEFAVKAALDSDEFCVKPNCHGQTKVFRLLHQAPTFLPIYFMDSNLAELVHILPPVLRPHLIFETTSSAVDLQLSGVILYSPEWSYASLFYHSRLSMWIFIDSRRILPLHESWKESRNHTILHGFRIVSCFYCKDQVGGFKSTGTLGMQGSISVCNPSPVIPNETSPPMKYGSRSPTLTLKQESGDYFMYDSQSSSRQSHHSQHQHSHLHSNHNEIDNRIYENWPLDNDSGQGSEFSSNCSSSNSMGYDHSKSNGREMDLLAKSRRSSIELPYKLPLDSPSSETTTSPKSGNKYATVRRKIKYQGKSRQHLNNSLSMSVPDLRINVPAPEAPVSSIRPVPIISSETGSRSSSEYSNKKVSFNCEVTLLDDVDDEYIPHPIFQSVLQKLQSQTLNSQV